MTATLRMKAVSALADGLSWRVAENRTRPGEAGLRRDDDAGPLKRPLKRRVNDSTVIRKVVVEMNDLTASQRFEACMKHTRDRLTFLGLYDMENVSISDSYFWENYHLLKAENPKWAFSARKMRLKILGEDGRKRRGEDNWEFYQQNHKSSWLARAIFHYLNGSLQVWMECIRVGDVV